MKERREFLVGVWVFAIILFIGLIVNGTLGISGFEGVYEDSLVSRYTIDGKSIKTRIESSLNIGKKLHLMDDTIKPLFSDTLENSSGIEHLYVVDTNNRILYTTRNITGNKSIPFNYYEGEIYPKEEKSPYFYRFLDSNFVCIPLFTGNTEYTGALLIEYSKHSVTTYILPYIKNNITIGLLVFAVGLLLFFIGYVLFGQNYKYTNISTIVLLIISQVSFSFYNYYRYNTALSSVFNTNMERLGLSITNTIEEPLKLAGDFEKISNVDEYLFERIKGNEHCSSIFIIDENNNIHYSAYNQKEEKKQTLNIANSDITVLNIAQKLENPQYKLALKINRKLINSILRDMALDSATIIIVALIFAFILKSYLIFVRYKDDINIVPEQMTAVQGRTVLRMIEISTFIFMFSAYITLSFIPLYIKEIVKTSTSLLHFSKETLESLPLSTYMIGIMVSMFITLFVMKNISVKKRYVIMSLIFILGSIITILSKEIILFALSRFICGFGFGGVLLSTSSLIMQYTNSNNRSAGFGTNAAAFASATITSIPVGGVIVNKFGYEVGVIVSIVFALAFLVFSIYCIPEEINTKKSYSVFSKQKSNNITIKDFIRVFCSRHVLIYILCINIPFQIIYWGLFQFLLPIYMDETLHLSQGNIGRILGIFSVVSLFAASVSKLADKAKNDKLLIGVGAIFAGIIMFIFGYVEGGIVLFFGIMIAMGFDNLFIDSIEEVYLESGDVRGVSEENILQTYKVIEKVLSVAVPSLTTFIIIKTGFNGSMQIIGGYTAIGALLFVVFGKNGRWSKK